MLEPNRTIKLTRMSAYASLSDECTELIESEIGYLEIRPIESKVHIQLPYVPKNGHKGVQCR